MAENKAAEPQDPERLKRRVDLVNQRFKELAHDMAELGAHALREVDAARVAGDVGRLDAEVKRLTARNAKLKRERDDERHERDRLQELWDGAETTEIERDKAIKERDRLRAAIEQIRDEAHDPLFRTWAKGVLDQAPKAARHG